VGMHVLVTGGAGFIGSNVAKYHLERGHHVTVLDNLCRIGARQNLRWLADLGYSKIAFIQCDVRDAREVMKAFTGRLDRVYHFAGQVAVTCSVENPREDFESNAIGTFNVLEGVRSACPDAVVLYASTNKVYGALSSLSTVEQEARYEYLDLPYGVPEQQPLDFCSPYGCSKGCGDQYVRDYARIYGLRTVVFRQSCIYGTRQFGFEDQGWLAHFCIAAHQKRPIIVYGNGKQVRDVLWIDDLIAAYELAAGRIDEVAGEIFNIGGGPSNSLSIWSEFAKLLEGISGGKPAVRHGEWRPGDQRIYISDIRKARDQLDWSPTVSPADGLTRLWNWIGANPGLFV
jgi:CDP-paratose 2-epimerase